MKSFERIWQEYTIFCSRENYSQDEFERNNMLQLEEDKYRYMHFYNFLKYTEAIKVEQ